MSFSVGDRSSKFVVVTNVTMRFAVSEKILFADLRTSRKTNEPWVDKDSGEVKVDESGNPLMKREFSHWEGRFVGNAFEPAKALKNGQTIDIVNGWIEKNEFSGKDGKPRSQIYVVISDFSLSATDDSNDTPVAGEGFADYNDGEE